MHRAQILLEEWQYERLKSVSERQGRSLSNVVREAVAEYLVTGSRSGMGGLQAIEGIGTDPEVSGRDHDRILYGSEERP